MKSSVQKGSKVPQYMAAFSAHLASLITGCIIAWTSPSIPYLEGPDSPIPITPEESSWIASLSPLSAIPGPFIAGFVAEKFGRKIAILTSAVPSLASWICLAAGNSVSVIYLGRALSGIATGWIYTVVPMYVGEIASADVRGALGSFLQIFIVLGLLYVYCIGPYVPYIWLSIACAAIPVLLVATFVWMPESPYYLVSKDEDAAERSLMKLRGVSDKECVKEELDDIKDNVNTAKGQQGGNQFKDLFTSYGNVKALIITLGLVVFQQFSGANAVLFNAQTVFEQAGGSLTPDLSAIVTGVMMLVASCVTPFLVERLGRKILFLASAAGMGVAEAVLGYCFYQIKQGADISSYSFLPVLTVVITICFYCIGFGSLPFVVMGEMFPPSCKSLASTFTACFNSIAAFVVTRFYNDLTVAVGNDVTFWIFAGCCGVAFVFVLLLLPETKGKTLTEIQHLLNNTKSPRHVSSEDSTSRTV